MKIDVKIQALLLVGVILACSPSHDWIEPHSIELDRTTTVSIRRTPNLSPPSRHRQTRRPRKTAFCFGIQRARPSGDG